MLYWNTELRSQSKVLPRRRYLALLIELLINKRLANKFPVVCLLGGVLLHIPAMLGGFLGCSATPNPKECLLLFVTSEAWRSSLPPCKHFFLSRAPAQCWKLPVCPVSPSFPSLLWALSNSSYLCELSCSLQPSLLLWPKGCILLPEYIIRKVSKEFYLCGSFFFTYMCYNHRPWKSQF